MWIALQNVATLIRRRAGAPQGAAATALPAT